MRKQIVFKLGLLLSILLIALTTKAQDPIVIQTVLVPPYPVYYSEIQEMPGLATVIIQNTDLNNSYTLRFKMTLDGGNGVSLSINPNIIPANPVIVNPGEVKTLTGDDLAHIYHGISLEEIQFTGLDPSKLVQTQRIPDGLYKLCIQAYDNETVKPLSGSEPTGCSNKMIITTLEPPTIISPTMDENITASDPQQVLIRWTTVNSTTSAMLYDIRIVEVPDGITAYDAMRTDNLLFYEENDYPATIYSYGPSLPPLVAGKKYAIQIHAHNTDDNANIRNNGNSDIITFNYRHPNKIMGASFVCSGPCLPPPRISNTTDIEELNSNDEITVGHFAVRLIEVTKTGDRFTGTGLLDVSSFFTAPIWVIFNNIGVNTNHEVYTGAVYGDMREEITQMQCYDEQDGFLPENDDDMNDIYDLILNPLSALTINLSSSGAHAGISLPVGYGTEEKNVAITRLELTPFGATMNLITGYQMAGDFRNGVANFVFGVKSVCVTPGGPTSNDNTTIALLRPIDYYPNANYTIRFKPGNARANKGTFASVDCDGWNRITAEGVVVLDSTLVKPEDENGEIIPAMSLAGKFRFETENPEEWMARLSFEGSTTLENAIISDRFRVVGYSDYSFSFGDVFIDNSLNQNPNGIAFPQQYGGVTNNTWKGIYVNNYSVKLPNYFNDKDTNRMEVNGQRYIFDDRGSSFDVTTTGLLTEQQGGEIKGWGFTIDEFHMQVVEDELVSGGMKGGLKMEIASNYLDYNAEIRIVNNKTRYNFSVSTGKNIDIDMWGAVMKLDQTSTIGLQIEDSDVDMEGNLTGEIALNDTIGSVDGINLSGIKFEELKIYSHAPYLDNATFMPVGNGVSRFGGFSVNINSVDFNSYEGNPGVGNLAKKGLVFDFDMSFGADDVGFSAGSVVELRAKKTRREKRWVFDDFEIGDITIHGAVPSVTIDGTLEWYRDDDDYGDGYSGVVAASFLDKITLKTDIRFGNLDSVDYWYVDGSAKFDVVAPIVGSLGIYGFGGGAYYNMISVGEYVPMEFGAENIQNRPKYVVRKNGWGFKAMVAMTTSDKATLSGMAQFEMSFRGSTVSRTLFGGEFAMMQSPQLEANSVRPMLALEGVVDLFDNGSAKYIDADFGYDINVPTNPKFIWGKNPAKTINFHDAGANDWHLYLGKPINMLPIRMGFDYELFSKKIDFDFGIESYFCIGTDLPAPPPFPADAPGNLSSIDVSDPVSGNTSGVMTGVHASFNMPNKKAFEVWGNGVSFRAGAGLGFDVAAYRLNGTLCNGSSDFGIDKWRISGQGYLYGFAHLRGKIAGKSFNIAGGHFTAGLKTILPNPSFFGAAISLGVDLPIYGNYNIHTNFKAGETCEYQMDDNFMDDLALEKLISSIGLSEEVDSVYAYDKGIHVEVKMNVPVGHTRTYTMADGKILKTKVGWEVELYEKINHGGTKVISSLPFKYNTLNNRTTEREEVHISGSDRGKTLKVYFIDSYRNSLIQPGKSYGVRVRAKLMYAFDNQEFKVLVGGDNKQAKETRVCRFVTKKPHNERIYNVVSAIPAVNERFFYVGDFSDDAQMHLQYSNDSLFDAYGHIMKYWIVFKDVATGDVFNTQADLNKNQKKFTYSMPRQSMIVGGRRVQGLALKYGRIYEVSFYVGANTATEVSQMKEIYTYHFRTSAYPKFLDKMNDLELYSKRYYMANSPSRKYLKLKFKLKESFGKFELRNSSFAFNDMLQYQSDERNEWGIQRRLMEYYARANDINISTLSDEFGINKCRYKFLGDLTLADVENARNNGYNKNRRVVLELDWHLNRYNYALWVLTKLHQDSRPHNNQASNSNASGNSASGLSALYADFNIPEIDWNTYTYQRFLNRDLNSFKNGPFIESPNSFDAKLILQSLININFSYRYSSGSMSSGKPTTGGKDDGKDDGKNPIETKPAK